MIPFEIKKQTSAPLFFLGARQEIVAVSVLNASNLTDCGTVHGSVYSWALTATELPNRVVVIMENS